MNLYEVITSKISTAIFIEHFYGVIVTYDFNSPVIRYCLLLPASQPLSAIAIFCRTETWPEVIKGVVVVLFKFIE